MAIIPIKKVSKKRTAYRNLIGDWTFPSLWLMKYRNLKHKPMQFFSRKDPFSHRPWQIGPVDDMSPTVVVTKGRQMGLKGPLTW